jgi:hypothetical protein
VLDRGIVAEEAAHALEEVVPEVPVRERDGASAYSRAVLSFSSQSGLAVYSLRGSIFSSGTPSSLPTAAFMS